MCVSITDSDFYLDQLHNCLMSFQTLESFKREAIVAVFVRLGVENMGMLKDTLRRDYKMNLDDPDTFTLEELQIALQRIVGQHGAGLLIREIQSEVIALERQQYDSKPFDKLRTDVLSK